MPEEEVVWNKTLLLVAVLLGLIAAALFFAYDRSMQKKLTGDMVSVLRWRDDFAAGRRVTPGDVYNVPIQRQYAMEGVLTEKDMPFLEGDNVRLSRSVRKKEWVLLTHVMGSTSSTPGTYPRPGMRAFTLRIDPNSAPGEMLHVHARVDVLALLSVPGQAARPCTILRNVRVLEVGGRGEDPEGRSGPGRRSRRSSGSRSVRSVTVEVKPRTVEQLVEVMDRIRGGKIWISVRPLPGEGEEEPDSGELSEEVAKLLARPLVEGAGP